MRIAIVGSGISGLTAAYLLHPHHDVTVFEAEAEIGGHTATKSVEVHGQSFAVDTGFIVYNDWTYPNFIKLLARLGVSTQPTEMGFSVFKSDGSYQYAGNSLSSLFAKRSLLLSAAHWRLLRDIVRFNKEAVAAWRAGELAGGLTLGDYLLAEGYGEYFCERYLVPMGAAIWSSAMADMRQFPAQFFVEFFHNHGLLSINQRPVWRVIEGGSRQYLAPLSAGFSTQIKLQEAVTSITRDAKRVKLVTVRDQYEFDHVILACHSNQSLAMLADRTQQEQDVLGALGYRDNQVTLHTDERLLPANKRAWASWNYCLDAAADAPPVLTYNMNLLQGIKAPVTFCVTLNAEQHIDPAKILGRYRYAHPVFTLAGVKAQARWLEINTSLTSFCGAYWLNGFHEDGVASALRVATRLGASF